MYSVLSRRVLSRRTRVRIRRLEMLVFRNILRTYLMDDPLAITRSKQVGKNRLIELNEYGSSLGPFISYRFVIGSFSISNSFSKSNSSFLTSNSIRISNSFSISIFFSYRNPFRYRIRFR